MKITVEDLLEAAKELLEAGEAVKGKNTQIAAQAATAAQTTANTAAICERLDRLIEEVEDLNDYEKAKMEGRLGL